MFNKDRGLYLPVRKPGHHRFGRPIRVDGRGHALVFPSVSVNSRGDVLAAWTASSSALAIDPVSDVPFTAFATDAGIQYSTRVPAG